MGSAAHDIAADQGLAFFGGVVAAQAHELRNVLNIINELAGLQRDLLAGGTPDGAERVAGLGGRIQAQVERGRQILTQVSQFAHSVDVPWVVFEVGEVLARVAFFAERVARLNRTSLTTEFSNDPVAVESNPFALQQVAFVVLQWAIAAATDRRAVTVGFAASDSGVEIWVRSADPLRRDESGDRARAVARLLGEVGGKVLESPRQVDDDGWRLWVPSRGRGGGE